LIASSARSIEIEADLTIKLFRSDLFSIDVDIGTNCIRNSIDGRESRSTEVVIGEFARLVR
jgi:hypothetical protein